MAKSLTTCTLDELINDLVFGKNINAIRKELHRRLQLLDDYKSATYGHSIGEVQKIMNSVLEARAFGPRVNIDRVHELIAADEENRIVILENSSVFNRGDWVRSLNNSQLAPLLSSRSTWNCPPDTKDQGGCPVIGCIECWKRWLDSPFDGSEQEIIKN